MALRYLQWNDRDSRNLYDRIVTKEYWDVSKLLAGGETKISRSQNCVSLLNLVQFCPGVVQSSPVPPQIFAERVFLATAEGTDPAGKHRRYHAAVFVS